LAQIAFHFVEPAYLDTWKQTMCDTPHCLTQFSKFVFTYKEDKHGLTTM